MKAKVGFFIFMEHKIYSMHIMGMDGRPVEVEASLSANLPSMQVVGLPDKSVDEARERIRSAIRRSGLNFPRGRVVINLAPAGVKKQGALYDLPMAVSILVAQGDITGDCRGKLFVGELALDGRLRGISGLVTIARLAKKFGFKEIFLPCQNSAEAGLITGLVIRPVESLKQLVEHLNGESSIEEWKKGLVKEAEISQVEPDVDLADVWGQPLAKRAITIAAAGRHNIALFGPPGCGKSLLAKAMRGLMPRLCEQESLVVSEIHSLAGLLNQENPLVLESPFRTPHHTATTAAMVGGGQPLRPGEISLACSGVLHLDEVSHYNRDVLQALREPLEERRISVVRANGRCVFPADFCLVMTMNPCPCGYWASAKTCCCSPSQIKAYWQKISGPLLDRIDLFVHLNLLGKKEIAAAMDVNRSRESESVILRQQITACQTRQRSRSTQILGQPSLNSQLRSSRLQAIGQVLKMDSESQEILNQAVETLQLSSRAYGRVLRVARTIADLDQSENIKPPHIGEALQYRFNLDLNFDSV